MMSLFHVLIPLLTFLSVFGLVLALLRFTMSLRLRREALALAEKTLGESRTAAKPVSRLNAFFFRSLPILGGWQSQWISEARQAALAKKFALVPAWRDRTAGEWLAAKEWAALGGGICAWLIGAEAWLAVALAAGAFWLPELWLREQLNRYRRAILRELPETLDLLAACMEAGLGFEQAVGVFLEQGRQGRLYDEWSEMMRKVRMGQSRPDALKSMGQRVDDADFNTFVTALIQAERMGVGVAGALKLQAQQLRGKHSQKIEKLALEAPVKLLFPLVLFIFPVVFMILFGPIVVRLLQGF